MSEITAKKKPRGKPFEKGGDPRRGKGGRVKDEHSITYWLDEFGRMSPVELSKRCATYARELRKGGDELPIFALIAVRQLMELMNDSDARLLNVIQDRTEGKVIQPIEWRQKVKDAGLDPDNIVKEVQEYLAAVAVGEGEASELNDG